MIRVIRKRPFMAPEVCRIPNDLKAMQRQVDGYIEAVTVASDCCIICNEEGRLKDLSLNTVLGMVFRGTVLVVGVSGDDFCDVPDAAINMVIKSYGGELGAKIRELETKNDEYLKHGLKQADALMAMRKELERTTKVLHELENAMDELLKEGRNDCEEIR